MEKHCKKDIKKMRDRRQRKDAKKLTKKKAGKSAAVQGENTEISAGKTLKIRKYYRLNTSKCYQNTDSGYTIEHTKHITNTYWNKNHQMISSKQQISSTYRTADELRR